MSASLVVAAAIGAAGSNPDPTTVVGGQPTPPGVFAATGAVAQANGEDQPPLFLCTGILIAPAVVLTAAHCLEHPPIWPRGLAFAPGFTVQHDVSIEAVVPPEAIHAGAEYHQHPDFDAAAEPAGLAHWSDLGLIVLERPVPDIEPALLLGPNEARRLDAGLAVTLVGYGVEQPDGLPGLKRDAVASLVEVGAWELLISSPGEPQNCAGDSGGPGLVEFGRGGAQRVAGIVSRGPGAGDVTCDQGGIHTRVDRHLAWIEGLVELPCGSGTSPPCGGDESGDSGDGGSSSDHGAADSGSDGGEAGHGTGAATGATTSGDPPGADEGTDEGCGCRHREDGRSVWAALALGVLAAGRRRRRRA